jgi:hypothetical protein
MSIVRWLLAAIPRAEVPPNLLLTTNDLYWASRGFWGGTILSL